MQLGEDGTEDLFGVSAARSTGSLHKQCTRSKSHTRLIPDRENTRFIKLVLLTLSREPDAYSAVQCESC